MEIGQIGVEAGHTVLVLGSKWFVGTKLTFRKDHLQRLLVISPSATSTSTQNSSKLVKSTLHLHLQ